MPVDTVCKKKDDDIVTFAEPNDRLKKWPSFHYFRYAAKVQENVF